uniref:Uncharacterized protein n=1 Tax=Oryzias melastigma TaxID=30732 RepID=A0A3B3E0R6_ORYME
LKLMMVRVPLRSDALETLLVHQFGCSRDLGDQEGVREPDDVCRQSDSRNLGEQKTAPPTAPPGVRTVSAETSREKSSNVWSRFIRKSGNSPGSEPPTSR